MKFAIISGFPRANDKPNEERALGSKSFKNLKKHFKDNGLVPRLHGLKGKKPHNTYPFEVIENIVKFLNTYASDNGLPMPAAPHGRDNQPPIYLTTNESKLNVYHVHHIAIDDSFA
ncbi:hypothetical protein QZH41_005608 [Actinostola sp. cb2023]|nr:hypothetical protein QZH41_005608 [Actinostola sp. cb2023]